MTEGMAREGAGSVGREGGCGMASNYVYSVLYRLSICVLPLIITPFSARLLGSEGVGLYAFSSSVACYFIIFGRLGLEHYGNRTIAVVRHDPEGLRRTFWSIYAMQCLTSVVSCLAYALLIHLLFPDDLMIYWMQGPYVASVLFDVSWYFYGTEQFRITTIRSLITRGLVVVAMFWFVRSSDDLWIYTLVMSVFFLVEQLSLWPFLLRQLKPVRVTWREVAVHFKPNVALFLPLIALSVYSLMDKLMLGAMAGNAEVAFYNYADSIINLPKGIVMALGSVMLPRLARLAESNDYAACQESLRKSLSFINMVSCALCFGIAGVAPVFVPFFLGPGFEKTVHLTMYLALVMIPMSIIDVIQTQYLIPLHKERVYIGSVTLGAVVNVILNVLFIPSLTSVGAVIGTFGAQLAVCAYQLFSIREQYRVSDAFHGLWPFFLCGAIECAVALSLGCLSLSPLLLLCIQIIGAGGMYLLCLAAVILRFRPDLKAMFGLFNKETFDR